MSNHRLQRVLGIALVLGGAAHSIGVSRHYFQRGIPDLNRILLDVWIAEAQIAAGVLFVLGGPAKTLAAAVTVWMWTIPFLPVLLHRAPPVFWVMPIVYSVGAALALHQEATTSSQAAPRSPSKKSVTDS